LRLALADARFWREDDHWTGIRWSPGQRSIRSEILSASSTSMPRLRTVLSSFVCPIKIRTARRFPVFLQICTALPLRIAPVPSRPLAPFSAREARLCTSGWRERETGHRVRSNVLGPPINELDRRPLLARLCRKRTRRQAVQRGQSTMTAFDSRIVCIFDEGASAGSNSAASVHPAGYDRQHAATLRAGIRDGV
jgi:hypothetical protein